MLRVALHHCGPAIRLFVLLSVLTGLVYPALVTVAAKGIFPVQAAGSLIEENGVVRGSSLIGQPFTKDGYFWGRPSATSPIPYDAAASSGSNLGPTNPDLFKAVAERAEHLRQAHGDGPIPVDLLTSSASGLDPHISPAAALYQVERVAKARKLEVQVVRELVEKHTEGRTFGVFGEPRVAVLAVNLDLDALAAAR